MYIYNSNSVTTSTCIGMLVMDHTGQLITVGNVTMERTKLGGFCFDEKSWHIICMGVNLPRGRMFVNALATWGLSLSDSFFQIWFTKSSAAVLFISFLQFCIKVTVMKFKTAVH